MSETPDVSTVSVTIDGRRIDASKGELVIAAAERNDVYIPRFCWHNRMNPVGMCRMCLVEIDTGRGPALQPSCMIECTDGMTVETKTETVVKAQEGVLEFLLINHPLDCPVCDKGGECPLQDQTMSHGPGESRYVEEKRHNVKPINVSDLVLLDRERCILCDRCTRFSKEVAGDPLIHFQNRGNTTEVNTFPEHPFASYFSGNTVQICPVGALTSTPYRFKARPWDLQQVESTCTGCSVGCRIVVDVSRDELLRFNGVDSEAVNWSWMCDKGRFGFEAFERGDRLVEPLARANSQAPLAPLRWNDALDRAAKAIKGAANSNRVAIIGGANLTNEAQFVWAKLAKGIIGTDNVDAQLGDGIDPALVFGLPRATINETCAPGGTILVVANDPKEELGVLYLRLRHAAVWDHAKIIEVSATQTGLTELAAASLRVRPGSEAALVSALLTGASAPEGIDANTFGTAQSLLGSASPLRVVLGRQSLAETADVTKAVALSIHAANNQATFLTTLRRANVYGALDMGLTPGYLPGRVTLDAGRAHVAAGWGVAANELPDVRGLHTAGILHAAVDGQIDTLILLGADPIADFADRDLATRALAKVGTLISVDLFANESNRQAHIVLPASGFGAEDGTTTNLEGRVSRVAQAVTPKGNAHADWVIAAELALAMGADLRVDGLDDIRAAIARTSAVHEGLNEAVLDETPDGVVFPLPVVVDDALAIDEAAHDASADDTASTDSATDDNTEATEASTASDNESATNADAAPVEEPAPVDALPVMPELSIPTLDAYSFHLVVTRKMYDQGTLVAQAAHLAPLATPAGEGCARLNSADLARLGVESGATVKVSGSRGQLLVPAVVDDGVPKGVVAFVHDAATGGALTLVEPDRSVTDVHVETVS